MRKPLKLALALLLLVATTAALMSLSGYALVFYPSGDVGKNKTYPFAELSFEEGRWDAYLIFGLYDYDGTLDDVKRKGGRVLRMKDPAVLTDLKKLKFKWHGELGTPPDTVLLIRKNGKIMFSAYILLERGDVGLQSSQFGFIKPEDRQAFLGIFYQFKRVYSPLVIL